MIAKGKFLDNLHSIYAHFVVLLRELNDWPLCVLAFIAVALAVFEAGIVSETKYNKTRRMETKTSVFATSNSVEKIIPPLKSRFFVVKLQAYTNEQFYQIHCTTSYLKSLQCR
jgi:hypothetical protein